MDSTRADKIAAARKKLREFESRKVNGDQNSTSPAPSVTSSRDYPNGRLSSVSNISGPACEDEHSRKMSYDKKDAECEQLKKQLAELHGYYSELHTAYSNLASKSSIGGEETHQQIVQLQSALSLLMEEKTDLQGKLRTQSDRIGQLEALNEEKKITPSIASHEMNVLQSKLAESERRMVALLEELKNVRSENADAQSNMRRLQQEKTETQARLRGVYKDKEDLEVEVKEARKEVAMKELYIRQLCAHNSNSPLPIDHVTIGEKWKEECERLRVELERNEKEKNELANGHSLYEAQLTDKCTNLAREVEELANSLAEERRKLRDAEDELEGTKNEMERIRTALYSQHEEGKSEGEVTVVGISEEEAMRRVDETAKRLTIAFEERLLSEGEMYRKNMNEIEEELNKTNYKLEETTIKLQLAEKRLEEDAVHSESLNSIVSELQNEKATVSRALSQNRQLKEQVVEFEEKLMKVMEEKMECELERERITHELNGLREEKKGKEEGKREEENKEMNINGELTERLDNTTRELQEVRDELRRSRDQNDSMNAIMQQNGEDENQNSIVVELTQAIETVAMLREENRRLREEMEEERRGREEERREEKTSGAAEKEVMHGEDEDGAGIIDELKRKTSEAEEKATRIEEESKRKIEELEGRIRGYEEEKRKEGNSREEGMMERKGEGTMDTVEELKGNLERERKERERLEHIRIALETENETIADHVVLYQHYRRVMRDRLAAKEEEVRRVEEERDRLVHTIQLLRHELNPLMSEKREGMENGEEEREGDEGSEEEGKRDIDTRKIHLLMSNVQCSPRSSHLPKCTQCIGKTMVL